MLISDLAAREVELRRDTFFDSCRRAFLSVFGRSSNHRLPVEANPVAAYRLRSVPARKPDSPAPRAVPARLVAGNPADQDGGQQWRRHPQLRQAPAVSIAPCRRSARLEAERGVILARGGKFADALEAFTSAAADSRIDLTLLPGFWDLPRQGMMSAVRAYERNRRIRDAAALEARLRHTLRPRAIKPLPPAGSGPVSASGD